MTERLSRIDIGRAHLDVERGIVHAPNGSTATLRPKTLELLLLLHRLAGHLVTREAMLDAVWPGVHVSDDSITQCVGEIRRALGDDAGLLRTVTRRGYILELAGEEQVAHGPVRMQTVPATAGVPVVAVMPFRLMTHDDALATFGQGVLEGVVGALATLREPVVISANTTLQLAATETDPRAVGARLGAGYVANGTLRRSGERLRLSVELADARSGAVLWQRPFDIAHDDGFETQDQVAAVIANTLAPRVQAAELSFASRTRPSEPSAYHLMMKARRLIFRMEPASFEAAGRLLRQALEKDPDYAPLQAALADWHSLRVGQGWSDDPGGDTAAIESALDAALARDGQNARALAMLGHNHTILRRRYADAVALFERALAAAPNDAETLMWTAPTFAWMGEGEEGVRRAARALALSPDDPFAFRYQHFLSIGHYASENLEAAAEWGLRSARGNPNYTSNLRVTAAALAALGRRAEAEPLVRRVVELEPGFRVGPMIARQAFRDDAARERYGRRLVEAGLPP